jgi:four helix bundle protein
LFIWSSGHLVIGSLGHLAIGRTSGEEAVRVVPVARGHEPSSEELKERTMQFALDVLRLVDQLPQTIAGDVVARQLARSATSVASNYRATCNARSRAEFIAKLGIVVEESDESEFWLDTCLRKPLSAGTGTERLHREAGELRAIYGRSLGTARANARLAKSPNPTTK